MRRYVFVIAAWCFVLIASVASSAHEVRPALVRITQTDAQHYDVLWKQPVNGDVAVHLAPRLSSGVLRAPPSISSVSPSYAIRIWKGIPTSRAPLDGQVLSVEGLEHTITDVLVSVNLTNGPSIEHVLSPRKPSLTLDLHAHSAPAASGYLRLGIVHILTGADHLLFVFGLLLLVGGSWGLVRTITAFTVAHSITLAATALGWVHVRSSVVEALVALSIVILAVELVRKARGEGGMTSRYPWVIAFAFGLLHGCAFAGALAEVGLPQQHLPLALFLFNVGVEIGQLLFIAAALLVIHLVQRAANALRLANAGFLRSPQQWPRLTAAYVMGAFAANWFFERLITGLSGASLA